MQALRLFLAAAITAAPLIAQAESNYVIVELDQSTLVERLAGSSIKAATMAHEQPQRLQTLRADISAQQQRLIDQLEKQAPVQVQHRYQWVTNGMALRVNAQQLAWLRANPDVRHVRPVKYLRPMSDASAEWVGADLVWQGLAGAVPTRGEGTVIGIADTGINPNHVAFRQQSSDGYTFPAVGSFKGLCASGGASCNNKLVGIYEFAGLEEGFEDTRGRDVGGHGTHVAGIAAGNPGQATLNGDGFSIASSVSGIAPRARIISYRVCALNPEIDEDQERCPTSSVLAAMDRAVADGVDVLNLSLGGEDDGLSGRYMDSLQARNAGVLLVAAAGNEGPRGSSVGTPATAPWVLAVANSTHDRQVLNSVEGFTGGVSEPPPLRGVGLTGALLDRPVVYAGDFGNARCSQGDDIDFPPDGSSNPFSPGTFNGQIVVCERGVQARVAKGFNVKAAGAGGMILLNQASDGATIVADEHFLPATHLTFEDGQQLLGWLDQGTGHRASLSGAQFIRDDRLGNRLVASSSRGPSARVPGVLAPEIAAPGSDILAPDLPPDGGVDPNYYGFKTGTSMATPQVAGAAALLKSLYPQWTPDDIRSALVTTASGPVLDTADGQLAGVMETGAGVLNVAAAVDAGFSLRESGSRFLAATGENVSVDRLQGLNLAGLVSESCEITCSWQRELHALRPGDWQLSVVMEGGATGTVFPETLSMAAAGETATIDIDVNVSEARLGQRSEGSVVLRETSSGFEQRLPISVLAKAKDLPQSITVNNAGIRGNLTQELAPSVPIDALYLTAHPLGRVESELFGPLAADDTPDQPYDDLDAESTRVFWVDVAQAVALEARYSFTSASGAGVNLYLGRDSTDAGAPRAADELCRVEGLEEAEPACFLEQPASGRYWVLVQGVRAADGSPGNARGELHLGVVPDVDSGLPVTYRAIGPGNSPDGVFDLNVSWEDARLAGANEWLGAISLGRFAEGSSDLGLLRLSLGGSSRRPDRHAPLPAGQRVSFPLNGRAVRTGDYFIAPPWQGGARVELEASDNGRLRLYLRQGESFDTAEGSLAAQADVIIAAGNSATLPQNVDRWFLAIENLDTLPDTASFGWQLNEQAGEQALEPGLWFNPARNGHGMEFNRSGDTWFLLWYSYDEAGASTWYLANATAQRDDYWVAPLQRFTWNGTAARGTVVGHVEITTDQQGLRISSALLGEGMSEPLRRLLPSDGCAPLNASGAWFDDSEPGWGFTLLAGASQETQVHYVYDQRGRPRWLLGQGALGSALTLRSFEQGFCAWCDWQTPVDSPAGSAALIVESLQEGLLDLDVERSADGFSIDWTRQSSVMQLSAPGQLCQ